MTTTSTIIDYCETFRLSDDCIGAIWHDNAGWYGNLHWNIEGDTDFCGPFLSVSMARQAVRAAFVLYSKEENHEEA